MIYPKVQSSGLITRYQLDSTATLLYNSVYTYK
jgi:hypothetical protein